MQLIMLNKVSENHERGWFLTKWMAEHCLHGAEKADLTLEQRSVYVPIMTQMVANGGVLPDDDEELFKAFEVGFVPTPQDKEDFRRIWPTVKDRFVSHPDHGDMLDGELWSSYRRAP
jgi:hypothetical protein